MRRGTGVAVSGCTIQTHLRWIHLPTMQDQDPLANAPGEEDLCLADETTFSEGTPPEAVDEPGSDVPDLHQEELRRLRIRQLREQARAGTIGNIILVARLVSQWCLAALILGASVAAGGLLRDSLRPRTIVVGEITAAPALKAGGLDARTLASRLADKLTALQTRTRTSGRKLAVANGWPQAIRIEIPNTGISIDQLQINLRRIFVEDINLNGELLEGGGVRSLTIRGNGIAARSFSDPDADLDQLMQWAAEHVMASLQPAEFAAYLIQSGRSAEAVRFSAEVFPGTQSGDQASLLNQWGNALLNSGGSSDEALALYQRATYLAPFYWAPRSNVVEALIARGEEQRAHEMGQKLRDMIEAKEGPKPTSSLGPWYQLTWNLSAHLQAALGDASAYQGVGSKNQLRAPLLAILYTQLHDSVSARFQLRIAEAAARNNAGDSTITARLHLVRGLLALEENDPSSAVRMLRLFANEYRDNDNRTVRAIMPTQICWLAHAEQKAGEFPQAEQTLASAGRYVDCMRFRADLLAERGSWPKAEQAYAAAVNLAPDSPAAYYSWALALKRRGRQAESIRLLELAVKRGPCWADPRKLWGDILVAQGLSREGMRHYDQALQLAPAWRELGESRRRLGPPRRSPESFHACGRSVRGRQP